MTVGEAEQACPAGRGAAQMTSRARTAARDKARAADREAAKDGNENVHRSPSTDGQRTTDNGQQIKHA